MIKYYRLFDLLNRRGMKKSDLLEILSSKTIAKLSKGANLNTDVIDKICLYLNCQPSDIMEVIEYDEEKAKKELIETLSDKNLSLVQKSKEAYQKGKEFGKNAHIISKDIANNN